MLTSRVTSIRTGSLIACVVCLGLAACSTTATTQPARRFGAQDGEWRTYGGDLAGTRYSALDQIDGENFDALEVAWRFTTEHLGSRPEFRLSATPLMVNGVLYTTGGTERSVVALSAGTGEMYWTYGLDEDERGAAAPRRGSGRGLAYWTDGQTERIIYVTPGYRMIALDATTGRQMPGFGDNGIVDLKLGLDQEVDLTTADIGLNATPVIARDTIIVGAAHSAGHIPKSMRNVKGFIRAYDVRTGERRWIFHTIPLPGEVGHESWEDESWRYTGNTGVWGQITVDAELGIVYLPVETPTHDQYGGHRPGNNLFGDSLVALDLETGERKWHFQLVHHDIWDWEPPCAPILVDLTVDGREIKAVAQPTKQGWVYVFDRVTGEPVWPIEEQPVPQGDVPGEWYSPTQPTPTKPPAFDRQGISADDLIDFTPELKAEAISIAARFKLGPLFTPPVVSTWDGPVGTLSIPPTTGGANWPGGAVDPDTNILYVFSNTAAGVYGLVHDPEASDMDFVWGTAVEPQDNRNPSDPLSGVRVGVNNAPGPQGLPLIKPPWAQITALDLNAGTIVWQVAHGETPDAVRDHPALAGLAIPRTGRHGRIGVLVTKTLVIAGEGGVVTLPSGERGAMLRAYDKATGEDVGAVEMPAPQSGSPMTYMLDGEQYIVLAISGGGYSGEFVAFRLPRLNQ